MYFPKRISCILATTILLCSGVTVPVSAAGGSITAGIGTVDASSLRLRASASTASATLDYAPRNDVVTVLGKVGSWYKVSYNLQEGYMHSDYLDVSTVMNVELGYGRVNGTRVNMRSGPGTGYSSYGKANPGDLAYIIGFNRQWYKVIWNEKICYIRSDYLDLTEIPYDNLDSVKEPLFFENGVSTGLVPSADALGNAGYGASAPESTMALRSRIVATAKKYIGVPYVWGGTTTKGFDCSGYVQYVFKAHGVSLPRVSRDQYTAGKSVSKADLQPGDLVFFHSGSGTTISHVGIYIGSGQFIHASSSKGVVISDLYSNYYITHYYGARNVLK